MQTQSSGHYFVK